DTIACLYSLKKLKYSNYSIVVVDNGSTDQSIREINNCFDTITFLKSEENRGYAAGNNLGINYAMEHGADYCWLLNNDTIVTESALNPLVERLENNSQMGLCGSKIIYYDQQNMLQALGGGTFNRWLGIARNFGRNKPLNADFDCQDI